MLDTKDKTIFRYYLEYGGERFKFRTKKLCVAHGKAMHAAGYDIKMLEEYDLWMYNPDTARNVHVDHQVFDRTNTWLQLDIDDL